MHIYKQPFSSACEFFFFFFGKQRFDIIKQLKMSKFICDVKQLKMEKCIKSIWQLIISTSNATLGYTPVDIAFLECFTTCLRMFFPYSTVIAIYL